MVSALSQGFLIGIGLSMLIGPVFFSLINTSINQGKRTATYLAVGISLSDLLYIFLAFWGINSLQHNKSFLFWVGVIGGCILLLFGIQSIVKKSKIEANAKIKLEPRDVFKNIFKGFLLNSMHPGVVLFWMATVGGILGEGNFTTMEEVLLFASSILTTFTIDLLKLNLAHKLSQYLTPLFIKRLNVGIGIILVLCGVYLLYATLTGDASQRHELPSPSPLPSLELPSF